MDTINISYNITNDYTGINPSKYISILKIRNLILLPLEYNQTYNIKLNNTINILDKTTNTIIKQKIVFSTGQIELYSNKYIYFYIANGIPYEDHEYAIILENSHIDLETKIHTSKHSAKLLIGSFILNNNYKYMFDTNIPILVNIDNTIIKLNINQIINKYNFYQPLTNNTILLFDFNYSELLYKINSFNYNILIRPLYYINFPLGSLSIHISDYSGVSNNKSEFKIFVNDKSYYINSNSLNIQNLTSNTYTIKIIDRFGLLNINLLNGHILNKNEFIVYIPLIKNNYKLSNKKLPIPRSTRPPLSGLANLMINLDHDQSFELLGPNNFYRKYLNGYQSLYNIDSGNYIINYNNYFKSFYIPPNEITFIP